MRLALKPERVRRKLGSIYNRSDFDLEFVALLYGEAERSHEFRDPLQIFETDEFYGGVHVTIRQADQGAGNSSAGPEDDVGIGAAAGGHGFVLERDFLFIGDLFEQGDDLGVIASAVGERGTLTHLDVAVLCFADGGVVGGMGDIDDECDVGFERISDLARPEQADLLHDIGDGADLGLEAFGFTEQAERFSDGEGANSVVEGPGHGEVVAEQFELIIEGDGVPDADELHGFAAGGDSDIDEDLVDLGEFRFTVHFSEVGGDIPDDPSDGAIFGVDVDPLSLGDTGIDTAETAHVDEAIVGDVVDGHGDFVGVGGEHDAGACALIFDGDTISVVIPEGFVGIGCDVIEPDPLSSGFVTGGAWSIHQGFQESQRLRSHGNKLE